MVKINPEFKDIDSVAQWIAEDTFNKVNQLNPELVNATQRQILMNAIAQKPLKEIFIAL